MAACWRPRDSASVLDGDREPQASFVADVAGEFVVALSVFDGSFWSDEAALALAAAP